MKKRVSHKGNKFVRHEGVVAKKGLGQHFLVDEDIAIEIVDSLLIPQTNLRGEPSKPNSVKVLEIGPGTGVLTKFLLMDERIYLALSEIDLQSIDKLKEKYPQFLYTLVPKDFLKSDLVSFFPDSLLSKEGDDEIFIIGNFPYNISSQIFFKILDNKNIVVQVVCMLQKEVAQRLAAPPGGKDYGVLTVLLGAWYDVEYLFDVPPTVFLPPPKVTSGVIRLWRNQRKELGCNEEIFRKVVKGTFGQRRKTLRNSLKGVVSEYVDKDVIFKNLEDTLLLDLRPEKLSVEDFITLAKCFQI